MAAPLRALCLWQDCPQSASERPQKLQPAQRKGSENTLGCVGWVQQPQRSLEGKVFQGCVGSDQ